ncbi:MAG: hypothetical protein M3362_01420 [Acidobacteriota bacterium]|nr:hypothetical protein [Acidobacteriota bacterium]
MGWLDLRKRVRAITAQDQIMANTRSRKGKATREKGVKSDPMRAVGDSFTMPAGEHEQLGGIKKKCLDKSVHVTKSEILRVGLLLAAKLSTREFLKLWKALPKLSPGRPRKAENKK